MLYHCVDVIMWLYFFLLFMDILNYLLWNDFCLVILYDFFFFLYLPPFCFLLLSFVVMTGGCTHSWLWRFFFPFFKEKIFKLKTLSFTILFTFHYRVYDTVFQSHILQQCPFSFHPISWAPPNFTVLAKSSSLEKFSGCIVFDY